MRFRERVRAVAQQMLDETGVLDPGRDAAVIARQVRNDPAFLAAFINDDLEITIRTTLRQAFPPSRDTRQVGSAIASREAIRQQVTAKVQQHAALTIPAPTPPPTYSVTRILTMTRSEIRQLATTYRSSSARDAIIGDWFATIAEDLDTDDTQVHQHFTRDDLETLFNAAKAQHLSQKGHLP